MIHNLQRIQIKIFSNAPRDLSLEPFLEIFARWRKEKHPAEWVDLADYAHISRGPGIVLIGQRCNFAFDMADPAPGILYTAKKGLTGTPLERLHSALQWFLELSQRLVGESEFPSSAMPRTDLLEIRFTDRLETPNAASTTMELRPAVQQMLDVIYGSCGYELIPQTDARQCYGFSVQAKQALPLGALLEHITKGSVHF
ncbi:MAG: hypothetical protein HY313_07660 [Acidobacteria bacterium]|nr:hypothetical protein [Acidobacteriota bacterium]